LTEDRQRDKVYEGLSHILLEVGAVSSFICKPIHARKPPSDSANLIFEALDNGKKKS